MDPLSVAASVVGLLAAAQKTSSAIKTIVTVRKSGLEEIMRLKATIDMLKSVLLQLQVLLINRATLDHKRASMILVDEVVVTLTACVMTFSDLDRCMQGLVSDEKLDLLDSIRWATKAPELEKYLRNLEAHKTSLNLMMNILTCQSAYSAENSASELKLLMIRVLESNEVLAERMSMVETRMATSVVTRQQNETVSMLSQKTVLGPTATSSAQISDSENFRTDGARYSFEEALSTSWVYRRSIARGPRAFSIATSTQRTQSWSMLSGLSLSNISNIAIHALPIYEGDLHNSELYSFGTASNNTDHASIHTSIKSDSSQSYVTQLRRRSSVIYDSLELDTVESTIVDDAPTTPAQIDTSSPASSVSITISSLTRNLSISPNSWSLRNWNRHTVLFVATCIHHSGADSVITRSRDYKWRGYKYLRYTPGQVFEVLSVVTGKPKPKLWLARNQREGQLEAGWVLAKHFTRAEPKEPFHLSREDGFEDKEDQVEWASDSVLLDNLTYSLSDNRDKYLATTF